MGGCVGQIPLRFGDEHPAGIPVLHTRPVPDHVQGGGARTHLRRGQGDRREVQVLSSAKRHVLQCRGILGSTRLHHGHAADLQAELSRRIRGHDRSARHLGRSHPICEENQRGIRRRGIWHGHRGRKKPHDGRAGVRDSSRARARGSSTRTERSSSTTRKPSPR